MSRWIATQGRIASVAAVVVLAACAQQPSKTLYLWETFPRQQYDFLLRAGASPADQIQAMQAHAEKARGANVALPPGFRAHMGLLQLMTGDAAAARSSFEAEKAAFPESTPYIDSLIKRLSTPVTEPKGSPA